ncbi:MAG: zinc-binding alcohol dehydrogenase [Planctomycetota bacterium]|nr:zinc-binding alcohol dehydrogenase [Planctomycetota bacterium]MDA1141901.1 zinc-binding alcohol dehydrogenase [Planctomycetota bacterium]
MKTQQILFTDRNKAELVERELELPLEPHQALVRAEHSVVSAGTEGAGFTGLVCEMPGFNNPNPYPMSTGYGHLGEVLEIGEKVTMCKPGDRVLSFSNHASVVKADAVRCALPVPKDAPGERIVYSRMAGVSISAVRSSTVQPGDTVLVIGLGLVGNFAAQLFQMVGAEVLASEISPLRIERARQCGIKNIINPNETDLKEAVLDWTGGKGVHIAVEAIGISELVSEATLLTRRYGEVILLGSPRAKAVFDATPMLLHIHLQAIRMIGSLEWRWPSHEVDRCKHNIVENYRQLVHWIAEERLIVDPLRTHVAPPSDCQAIYTGLTSKKEEYLSGVFVWQ